MTSGEPAILEGPPAAVAVRRVLIVITVCAFTILGEHLATWAVPRAQARSLPGCRSGWARRDNVSMLAGHVTTLFRL